jgi:RES domain
LTQTIDNDFPLPPSDLDNRSLPISHFAEGKILFRIHETDYHPVFFGRSLPHRFDAPVSYGVLYAGIDKHVALRETIFRDRLENLMLDRNQLSGRIAQHSISDLVANRALKLVKAYDDDLLLIGATNSISREDERSYTQKWSRALWQHPDFVDGIIYRSHLDENRLCVALYSDRVDGVLFHQAKEKLSSNHFIPTLIEIINGYGIGTIS